MSTRKCPQCNRKAGRFIDYDTKEVVITCQARENCGYVNRRKYD